MEKLYDVLAGITAADDELKDMIEILHLINRNVDVMENNEDGSYIRLLLRWMVSLEKDIEETVTMLDIWVTNQDFPLDSQIKSRIHNG